jgi:two-component system, OmpR family, sensor histidine kinase PhoQ
MSSEITAVESGKRSARGDDYPGELAGVARGLNTLLRGERQRMDRYRTTMDDLAHSLKTPLAVLRTELGGGQADAEVLNSQVDRMQAVIDYQLRRAAASGPRSLALSSVAILPVLQELVGGLKKIHSARVVDCRVLVSPDVSCAVETGDLYEILGNLLDNAWKWCAGQIEISAAVSSTGQFVELRIQDDGPGIPDDQTRAVLGRGIRADQRGDVPGQGIGLAVVQEIVGLYGGELRLGRSHLAGADVVVRLPAR